MPFNRAMADTLAPQSYADLALEISRERGYILVYVRSDGPDTQ